MLINSEIRFEVTNRCGYSCVMCPREKLTRKQGNMSFELFKKGFDEGMKLGMNSASLENFGEAFLDPTFFEKVKYAREIFPEVYLMTISTGGVLTKEKCDLLLHYQFNKIRFSYYGLTKEVYQKIHGVSGEFFETATKNIDYLINEKIRLNLKYPLIEVYFLELEENKHQVEDFKKKFEGRANDISIWKPHNWSTGRDYRNLNELGKQKRSCGRPNTGPIQIQWDGKLVPCCFDYNSEIVLGDLNKNSLKEILNSKEYNDLRDAHNKREFDRYPFCNKCDQLYENEQAMIYTTIKNSKYGVSNTNQLDLLKK